jgi:hypothetical protein
MKKKEKLGKLKKKREKKREKKKVSKKKRRVRITVNNCCNLQ